MVPAGEDPFELPGWRSPCVPAFTGSNGKAPVEVDDELGEIGSGLLGGDDATQPQLDDEAVLKCLPQSLDPAFALRAEGGDVIDGEIVEHLAQMSGVLFSEELFLEAPLGIVTHENTRSITVDTLWEAEPDECLLEDECETMEILMRAKHQGKDLSRSVIHRPDESHAFSAALEPREGRAVDEDHRSHAGFAFAPPPMTSWPATTLGSDSQLPPDSPHRFPADLNALELPELLDDVAIVHPNFGTLEPKRDSLTHLRGHPAPRRAAPVPVQESLDSQTGNPLLQPAELTQTQSGPLRPLSIRDSSLQRVFQRAQTPGVPNGHENPHGGT